VPVRPLHPAKKTDISQGAFGIALSSAIKEVVSILGVLYAPLLSPYPWHMNCLHCYVGEYIFYSVLFSEKEFS